MPRKFIDKKKAATFHLVHRSHRDPLINDPDSSSRVLKYVAPSNSKGPITRSALEATVDVDKVRENEGEAAEYGIFFDDTEYDYMQHLRSVGDVPDGILLEAPTKDKGKGKAKELVFGEKVNPLRPI
jgi:protein LTV1